MTDVNLTSPLPPVETPNQLSFWQSVGIAAQLCACHRSDNQEKVESFWSRIAERIQQQSLLILFNAENKPVGFSSWINTADLDRSQFLTDIQANLISQEKAAEPPFILTDLVFPFSSPLYFHRFLHSRFTQQGENQSALLISKTKGQPARKIW
jgi:hemolysin-activating ACP:hemolysin acyltransferase